MDLQKYIEKTKKNGNEPYFVESKENSEGGLDVAIYQYKNLLGGTNNEGINVSPIILSTQGGNSPLRVGIAEVSNIPAEDFESIPAFSSLVTTLTSFLDFIRITPEIRADKEGNEFVDLALEFVFLNPHTNEDLEVDEESINLAILGLLSHVGPIQSLVKQIAESKEKVNVQKVAMTFAAFAEDNSDYYEKLGLSNSQSANDNLSKQPEKVKRREVH